MEQETPARRLWAACHDLAEGCWGDPFVSALVAGTLPTPVFRRYVEQDSAFLNAFFRAYALLAAAPAPDARWPRACVELLQGVLEELELHRHYAAELGIDLERARPLPQARAYTDFLLATAWQGPPALTLAAMAPCMRLYAWLGQRAAAQDRPDHPYGKWIRSYASEDFEGLARTLEDLLDAFPADEDELIVPYRHAMHCERAFFAASFEAPLS